MLVWKDCRAPLATAIALVCWSWLWNPPAAAQSCADRSRPLIVVADFRDAECARRIGGELVAVELLFLPEPSSESADYDACNARAMAVREFSIYLVNARSDCPRERFWRDRLSRGNPRGQVVFLGGRQLALEHDAQRASQQATDIHRALVTALPRYREVFDDNLQAEFIRLHRLSRGPARFVSSD